MRCFTGNCVLRACFAGKDRGIFNCMVDFVQEIIFILIWAFLLSG